MKRRLTYTDDEIRRMYISAGWSEQLEEDHLQAREDVKRLAAELRATAFYRNNHGDGALCWCGPEYGPCYVGGVERDEDCERKSKLLAEVEQ